MILSSRQLEELENLHDTSTDFEEESEDGESVDEGVESALAWRRGMIEQALTAVQRIGFTTLKPFEIYPVGTLLFDSDQKRFGRVTRCNDEEISLTYVSGGTRDINWHNRRSEPPVPVAAKAAKLSKTAKAKAVAEKKPVNAPKVAPPVLVDAKKKAAPAPVKKATKPVKAKAKPEKKKAKVKAKVVAKPIKKAAKPVKKAAKPVKKAKKVVKAAPKKAKKLAKAPVKKAKKVSKPTKSTMTKKKLSKQTKKPVKRSPVLSSAKSKKKPAKRRAAVSSAGRLDPNGYIKQHYKLMSNKEMAGVTGLSEHTIRRKLGEWGLKRPNRGL